MMYGWNIRTPIALFLLSTVFLWQISSMLSSNNVYAQQPRVEITSSQPTPSPTGEIRIPSGRTSVEVVFNYRGIEGNDRLTEFQCTWHANIASSYNKDTCPIIDSGRNTYAMTGHVNKDLPRGSYMFGVKVLNSGPVPNPHDPSRLSPAATRQFTVTPPPIGTNLTPRAEVFKANSYNVDPTTGGEASREHTVNGLITNGLITPYHKMYIVFQAYYGGTSDIDTGARTTFECKFDRRANSPHDPFVECGRFNLLTDVPGGQHNVIFRAKNPGGAPGPENEFTWCVTSCINDINWEQIDLANVDSFYGPPDDTISAQDLKEFSILNKTGGKNTTLQNMISGTNTTNVTNSGLNDTQISPANESPSKG